MRTGTSPPGGRAQRPQFRGNSPDEARRHYELLVEDVDGMNPARHRCARSSAPRPRAVARFRSYTSPSFPVKNAQRLQVEGDPEHPWQRLQVSARLIHSLGWPVLLLLYHMARWLYVASRWDMMLDGAVHSWSTRQVAMALEGRRYPARCL